jgi:hypothetical protein
MLPLNTDCPSEGKCTACNASTGAVVDYQNLYSEERKHSALLREIVIRLLAERYGVV